MNILVKETEEGHAPVAAHHANMGPIKAHIGLMDNHGAGVFIRKLPIPHKYTNVDYSL